MAKKFNRTELIILNRMQERISDASAVERGLLLMFELWKGEQLRAKGYDTTFEHTINTHTGAVKVIKPAKVEGGEIEEDEGHKGD